MDKLLTTEEASHILGRSPDWVRRRCADGTFRFEKNGDPQRARVYVEASSVEAYLAERVRQRVRVQVAHTENAVANELLRRRRERRRQPKAS